MITEVAGPVVQTGASRFWFVRVVGGDCARAAFSIPQDQLRDERDTPELAQSQRWESAADEATV